MKFERDNFSHDHQFNKLKKFSNFIWFQAIQLNNMTMR